MGDIALDGIGPDELGLDLLTNAWQPALLKS